MIQRFLLGSVLSLGVVTRLNALVSDGCHYSWSCPPGQCFNGDPYGCWEMGMKVGYYCYWCDPGTYAANSNQRYCDACPVGTYQPDRYTSSCIQCPGGTYNGGTGANSVDMCTRCPAGTFSTALGATSGTTCQSCGSSYDISSWLTITRSETRDSYKNGRSRFIPSFLRIDYPRCPVHEPRQQPHFCQPSSPTL